MILLQPVFHKKSGLFLLGIICLGLLAPRNATASGAVLDLLQQETRIRGYEEISGPFAGSVSSVAVESQQDCASPIYDSASGSLLAPKSGGRLGSDLTRAHIDDVASELESRGWAITHGGQRNLHEEYLRGPGGARKGSSYPDITATKNGKTLRVNTVDTYADGITPTKREAASAVRIRAQRPGDHLLLIPKPKPKG